MRAPPYLLAAARAVHVLAPELGAAASHLASACPPWPGGGCIRAPGGGSWARPPARAGSWVGRGHRGRELGALDSLRAAAGGIERPRGAWMAGWGCGLGLEFLLDGPPAWAIGLRGINLHMASVLRFNRVKNQTEPKISVLENREPKFSVSIRLGSDSRFFLVRSSVLGFFVPRANCAWQNSSNSSPHAKIFISYDEFWCSPFHFL